MGAVAKALGGLRLQLPQALGRRLRRCNCAPADHGSRCRVPIAHVYKREEGRRTT